MRIRPLLLRDGFALAYVENPEDLRDLIARMRAVKRPVFLLATSNGTAVAARNAAGLGAAGPDGVVLTSTVTRTSRRFPYTAAAADLRKITVPVLFVENTNDTCAFAPPAGVNALMARFPSGADVTRIDVASTLRMGDVCEPFSPHGYAGIEVDVTAKIVDWMRARIGPG